MTSAANDLRAAAATGILVKDGPYGTAIQNLGLTAGDYAGDIPSNHDQKGNNDILNLTRPDAIAGICKRYIAAGAHLLATNTFNANRISQADYGMEDRVREINLAAARIMRECVDEAIAADGIPRWVAGSLGPTNKTLSLSPRV
ncbi:homocysteine S-methyltransferase family protein, partial [Sandarakinorhabdus sp.]|uniref:homocysteine S-methyltransferase family protein n=1 Tax=Sandarakinorhabdus sp. TaxID=1916663 RepID=UPI00286E94A6